MTDIDYTQFKIVGVVEAQPNTKHAIINAVGYLGSDWKFTPLSPTEAKQVFPSRGRVFAPGFQDRYKELIGKCIFAGMMPSNNDGADKFIWDRENGMPDEYGTVIINGLANEIDENPDKTYKNLKTNGRLDNTSPTYLCILSKLYLIDPDNIKKYYITEMDLHFVKNANHESFVTYDHTHYVLIGNHLDGPTRAIDIMPDSILRDWLIKEFLVKEWSQALNSKSLDEIENGLIGLISKSILHKPVLKSRINRLSSMLELFVFSYQAMTNFLTLPTLKRTIDKSIEINSEKFIEKTKSKYAKELENLKETNRLLIEKEHTNAADVISKIHRKIEEANAEFNANNEELNKKTKLAEEIIALQLTKIEEYKTAIEELENTLHSIEDNKEHIINDFAVIKDVMQIIVSQKTKQAILPHPTFQKTNNNAPTDFGETIESLNDESEEIKLPQTFKTRLEFYLTKNNRKTEIAKKIGQYMVHYKAILVPDNRIIHSIIKATGRCKYSIQYVTPEWRSFSNVWNNGLNTMIHSCISNPDIIHYYILENINMSYLPCYLQPIVDISMGLRINFPNTEIIFPDNLRLLLTSTAEEGLPLAQQSIRYFGCLQNDDYTIDEKKENLYSNEKSDKTGYLKADMLKNMRSISPIPSNEYLSYIQSDYE